MWFMYASDSLHLQLLGRAKEGMSRVLPIPLEGLLPLAPNAEPSWDSPTFRP